VLSLNSDVNKSHFPRVMSVDPSTIRVHAQNETNCVLAKIEESTENRIAFSEYKGYTLNEDDRIYKHIKPSMYLIHGKCLDISVVNLDTLVAAQELVDDYPSTAILNMASFSHPGGGWKHGALAQEEELCRRTTILLPLYAAHRAGGYDIPMLGMIYMPCVSVLRSTQPSYSWIHPFTVAVLTSPAICCPKLDGDGKLSEDMREITVGKIELMLAAAAANGCKALVLGAFGCGAYHNPPNDIASIFKEVLERKSASFSKIVFAIIGGGDNYSVFKRTLQW
jgi:uncharacterized protein (TIGR02452 family)